MPVLWALAFCMSYPQVYYKELVTISTNKFVAIHAVVPMSDWIGEHGNKIHYFEAEIFRFLQQFRQE